MTQAVLRDTPTATAYKPPFFFAALIAAIGASLASGGAWLILLGGSAYYLITGALLLLGAALLFRGQIWGERCYTLALWDTLAWALSESGIDPWALTARTLALSIIGLWFMTPWLRRGLHSVHNRWWHSDSGWTALFIIVVVVIRFVQFTAFQEDLPDTFSMTRAPQRAAESDAAAGEWHNYGNTLSGQRFSTLSQITPENVGRLKVAWIYRSGEVAPQGNIADESTPLKVGHLLYKCTPHSAVIALDARTGREQWRADPKLSIDDYYFSICRGVAYYHDPEASASVCADSIFAAGVDGKLRAVDAATGKTCPSFGHAGTVSLIDGIGKIKRGYYIFTSPPTIVNSHLVIGSTVYDDQSTDMPSGVIRSYDARTGALQWAWDMGVPDRIGPPADGQIYTRDTPNSWPPFSADQQLGLVYLPMGNPGPDFFGGNRRPFDEKYGSAVVALNVSDGRPRWSYQTTHHDLWDYDLPAQPVLVDIPTSHDAAAPAVIVPTKRGDIFVLDRSTGVPIVPVTESPAPGGAIAGDMASPTQPVSSLSFMPPVLTEKMMWGATPIDMLACRIKFRRARYDGPFTPPGLRTTIQYPGLDGSINWGSVSINDDNKIMVSGTADMPWIVRLVERAKESNPNPDWPQTGTPYVLHDEPFLGPLEMPCMQPPWGHIAAVDLKTNKVLWRRPLGTARDTGPLGVHVGVPLPIGIPSIGGTLTTRSGLVFVGATLDNYLRALDLRSGRELWRGRLPAGGQANPMTYIEDGKQYIVVTAAGHLVVRTERGDYTVAYTLSDTP